MSNPGKAVEPHEDYLAHLKAKGYAASTILARRYSLRLFFSYLAHRNIEDMRSVLPAAIDGYKVHLFTRKGAWTGRSLSPVLISAHLHAVKHFFDHLAHRKQILLSPAQHLEIFNPPKSIPQNIPTEKEMEALLRAPGRASPEGLRDKALFELLYSTGIRRRELLRLRVQDVDLAQGQLTVRDGKGGKDRVLPVGRTACDALSQYLVVRHRIPNAKFTGGRFSTTLFLTRAGYIKDYTLTILIREYMRRAGVRHTTCHKFRHACATHMLRGGANVRMVQELLGHARLETTQIYTHVAPVDLKEAHRKHHPHGKMDKRKTHR